MKVISEKWEEYNSKLDGLSDSLVEALNDPLFKKMIVLPLHLNSYIMHQEISLLLTYLDGQNKHILEVGGGFGNFCKCFHDRLPVASYTIMDTTSMLRFCKLYLSNFGITCNYLESTKYEQILNKPFDIFISNICLSELPLEFTTFIVDNVLPMCGAAFIIDTKTKQFSHFLGNKLVKIFEEVHIYELQYEMTWQLKQNLYLGKKNE